MPIIAGNYMSDDAFGIGALQNPSKTKIVVQGTGCYITSPSDPTLIYYINAAEKTHFQSAGCKYLLSFGGEASLTTLLNNATLRSQLVTNLANVINNNGFDGLQFDWEDWSGNETGAIYHLLLVALRAAIPGKIIMPAIPADTGYGWVNLIDMPYIDYLVLMIYGGPGAAKIGTSLSYFTSSITSFINAGYPAAKILAGVPVYTDDSEDLFGAYYQTIQQFQPDVSLNQLSKTTANGLTNWAPANNKTVNGGILYFNGADLMKSKTQWSIDHALGGMYLWILNWDATPGSPHSLLDVAYNLINPAPPSNLKTFGFDSGSAAYAESANRVDAIKVQNTAGTGVLTKLELKFNQSAGQGKVRMGLYADNNGVPGNLLFDAGEVAAGPSWVNIPNLNYPVVKDVNYWIAFALSAPNTIEYTSATNAHTANENVPYGPLPGSLTWLTPWSTPYVVRATVAVGAGVQIIAGLNTLNVRMVKV